MQPPPLTSSRSLPLPSSQAVAPLAPSPILPESRLSPPRPSPSFHLPVNFLSRRDSSAIEPRYRGQFSQMIQTVEADLLDEVGDALKAESARRRQLLQQQFARGPRTLAIEGKCAFPLPNLI